MVHVEFCRTISGQPRRAGDSKLEMDPVEALRCNGFHEKACRVDCIKWFTILVVCFCWAGARAGFPGVRLPYALGLAASNVPHGAGGDPS